MNYKNENIGIVQKTDLLTENGQLFLGVVCCLEHAIFGNVTHETEIFFETVLANTFPNRRKLDPIDARNMSGDNLDGIFSGAFLIKSKWLELSWEYLTANNFTWPNAGDKWPFQPAKIFPWALCGGTNWHLLFTLPFYWLAFIITLLKPKENTSGKILTFVELYPHKDSFWCSLIWKIYIWKMQKQYGDLWFYEINMIFHNDEEHPICKLAKQYHLILKLG